VTLHVSIEYLRERFPESGDYFVVTLINCRSIEYRDYDTNIPVRDLSVISKICPGILSAELNGSTCRVFGDIGILDIDADTALITLDSGVEISLQDIQKEATAYWNAFSNIST